MIFTIRNAVCILLLLLALPTSAALAQRVKTSGCPDDWGTPQSYLSLPSGYNGYAYFCVSQANNASEGCIKIVGGPYQMFFGTSTKELEDACNAIDPLSGVQAKFYSANPKDAPIPPQLCKAGSNGKAVCATICTDPKKCPDKTGLITPQTPHGPS